MSLPRCPRRLLVPFALAIAVALPALAAAHVAKPASRGVAPAKAPAAAPKPAPKPPPPPPPPKPKPPPPPPPPPPPKPKPPPPPPPAPKPLPANTGYGLLNPGTTLPLPPNTGYGLLNPGTTTIPAAPAPSAPPKAPSPPSAPVVAPAPDPNAADRAYFKAHCEPWPPSVLDQMSGAYDTKRCEGIVQRLGTSADASYFGPAPTGTHDPCQEAGAYLWSDILPGILLGMVDGDFDFPPSGLAMPSSTTRYIQIGTRIYCGASIGSRYPGVTDGLYNWYPYNGAPVQAILNTIPPGSKLRYLAGGVVQLDSGASPSITYEIRPGSTDSTWQFRVFLQGHGYMYGPTFNTIGGADYASDYLTIHA